VKPFAERVENFKAITKEVLAITATLHMFAISTDAFPGQSAGSEVRTGASWSFVGVFLGIMIFNVLIAVG